MQKGSGVLWALERRGTMQLARYLLQASVPAMAQQPGSRRPPLAATPRRERRRPRTATTLRLVLS